MRWKLNKIHVHLFGGDKKYSYLELQFGDQLHCFLCGQVLLRELATMGLLNVVLQWPCGLTGDGTETMGQNNIKMTMGVGDSGGSVL